jgi:hypothetical protein
MKDVVSGCTILLQRVFTTVVLTIVAFPAHPPCRWLIKVWVIHYPERLAGQNRIDAPSMQAEGSRAYDIWRLPYQKDQNHDVCACAALT